MDEIKTIKPEHIIDEIMLESSLLAYDIFPGLRKLRPEELKSKYLMKDPLVGFQEISAPIRKTW